MRKLRKFIVPVVMLIAFLTFSLTVTAAEIGASSEKTQTDIAEATSEATAITEATSETTAETEATADTEVSVVAEEPGNIDSKGDDDLDDVITIEAVPEADGDAPLLLAAPDEEVGESVAEVFLGEENGEPVANGISDLFEAKGAAPHNANGALETTAINDAVEKNHTVYYICGAAVLLLAAAAIIFAVKKKKH